MYSCYISILYRIMYHIMYDVSVQQIKRRFSALGYISGFGIKIVWWNQKDKKDKML